MNNPEFLKSFTESNPGLMDKINALKNSNDPIMSKEELLSKVDDIKKFLESLPDALKETLLALLNSGKLDPSQLVGNIKDALLEELKKLDNNNPELQNLLKEYENNLTDKEKAINLLNKEDSNSIESDQLNKLMNGLDSNSIVDGFSDVLVNNPNINEAFNAMIDAMSMNLTPEEIKNKLLELLSGQNNEASVALLKSLIRQNLIEPTIANKLNDNILNDPKNTANNEIMKFKNENIDFIDKLKQISELQPNLNEACLNILKDIISTLSDEQLKALFKDALSDPAFLDAINQLNQTDSKTAALMDALNSLNLSPESMRNTLINADNKDFEFASACNKITSKYEEPTKADEKVKQILKEIENLTNLSNKDKTLEELNKVNDNTQKLYEIDKNKEIVNALKDNLPPHANNSVNHLDDENLKKVFKEITSDPALLKKLLDANPDLLNQLENMIKNNETANNFEVQNQELMKEFVEEAKNEEDLYQEKTLAGVDNEELNQAIEKAQSELEGKINAIISLKIKEKTKELYEKFKEYILLNGTDEEKTQIEKIEQVNTQTSFLQLKSRSKVTESEEVNILDNIDIIIKKPAEFEQSNIINDFNTFLGLKYKVMQELAFTNEIDTLLANAIKKKFIKNEKLIEIKIEVMNYIQKITDPNLYFRDYDNKNTIIEYLEKLKEEISK